jgi:2-polyprenyl-3-methyl-5-hydroxy-6-metoxy-1,4-benzoquinol methylase
MNRRFGEHRDRIKTTENDMSKGKKHVCPWWMGYLLASPLRRLKENPTEILAPHVREGMTVVDFGSAMGFFSLPLATLVGKTGRVVCLDIQEKMLTTLTKRARKAGLGDRIETRLIADDAPNVTDLAGQVDFVLAAHVIHETLDAKRAMTDLAALLNPGGRMIVREPGGHVSKDDFAATLKLGTDAGLTLLDSGDAPRGHTAVLERVAD